MFCAHSSELPVVRWTNPGKNSYRSCLPVIFAVSGFCVEAGLDRSYELCQVIDLHNIMFLSAFVTMMNPLVSDHTSSSGTGDEREQLRDVLSSEVQIRSLSTILSHRCWDFSWPIRIRMGSLLEILTHPMTLSCRAWRVTTRASPTPCFLLWGPLT
jgi:hypothetical protein